MTLSAKISLVRSLLDELTTVDYLHTHTKKRRALWLIRNIVRDFVLLNKPKKADATIYSIKLLAHVQTVDIDKQIQGLRTLAEKALSELHTHTPKAN